MRPRLLFVAEDVTLAHVGRMLSLAGALDPERYEVKLACGDRYAGFVEAARLERLPLRSLPSDEFNARLLAGRAVHTEELLRGYLADDRALLEAYQPTLVIGDFRVSLGISTEVLGIPYAAVVNATWSPETTLPFPIPDHPAVRLFGLRAARLVSPALVPLTFASYLAPFNRLRREHGLAPLPSLRHLYCHGTWALFPDLPELAPVRSLRANQRYLGPLVWEPGVKTPPWWDTLPTHRPVVYLSAGTSGTRDLLDAAARALRDANVTVIAACADTKAASLPENFFTAPFLPGLAATARAQLVICNGGSGTIYQALTHGAPLLGVASNADQHLAMHELARRGAGELLRSDALDPSMLRGAVDRLLTSSTARTAALELRARMATHDAHGAFRAWLDEALATSRTSATKKDAS